jgi:RNA polymerase sigma-70 factor, ECF subfamily
VTRALAAATRAPYGGGVTPADVPSPTHDRATAPSSDVTRLLRAWSAGDEAALDALLPIVYAELHAQAARAMRRAGDGHTLQPTAVVHEAYLRIASGPDGGWQGRAHFFGVAAKVMRSVLVDHARARVAAKRGGVGARLGLSAAWDVATDDPADGGVDVLALDAALDRLASFDPHRARVVELRYITGLTIEETAAVLGVSPATIKREWTVARAWLRRELAPA